MSVVKGKLVKMEVIQVGEYEFTKQDIIGHGAFAMVYKGRKRKVTICAFFIVLLIFVRCACCLAKSCVWGFRIMGGRACVELLIISICFDRGW